MAWPMPDVRHLLLCRRLVPDPLMHQPTLVNVLHTIHGPALPFVFNEFHLLVQLTNGFGRYGLTIDLVRLDDEAVIARAGEVALDLGHRLTVYNFHRRLRDVPFGQFGIYEFRLYARMLDGPGAGIPRAAEYQPLAAIPLRVEGQS